MNGRTFFLLDDMWLMGLCIETIDSILFNQVCLVDMDLPELRLFQNTDKETYTQSVVLA